jgi:succinate-semialdehyde dehydrogenase/glutarate-semialdehyde dehydrogenase
MSAAAISLLSDPSLLKTKSYVNGDWVEAKSGKWFSVDSKSLLIRRFG